MYAVASDKTDRFTSLLELFPQYVATADAVFNNTAEQGGAIRHVRWATTASCKLDVMHVVLSSTGDDSLTAMRSELIALGLNRTDRKYLVWVDASVYCGIANVTNDDSPGVTNKANTGPHFARVDAPCWGSANSLEAHEILHSLGAVQLSAPHTTGAWHCSDEYDRMCYNDGSGVPLTYDCAYAWESLFDCGSNDYFAINPAGDSYLATHWNVANSTFLATTAPGSTPSPSPTPTTPTTTASPSPTPSSSSPTPTTTPTSEPTPTATPERVLKVKQGRLTQKAPGRFYSFRTSGGGARARLTFKGEQSLRVKFVNQLGEIVASRVATSGFALSPALSAGRYVVTVGRSTSATFTLRWRYWAVPG